MDRDAILKAIEDIDAGAGSAEKLSEAELLRGLYPVPSQARSFEMDRIVIVGGRGTGKTQIFRALLNDRSRAAVVRATGVRLTHDITKTFFIESFAAGSSFRTETPHPAADTIEAVLKSADHRVARKLWLGLSLARLSIDAASDNLPEPIRTALAPLVELVASPSKILKWMEQDAERPFTLLDTIDAYLSKVGLKCVFTFDALDRAANDWEKLEIAVGGLLSLALDLARRSRSIRLKVFLRPDLETAGARSFPDASKLRGYREELNWERTDLYRLAFKRIVAHPEHGAAALALIEQVAGKAIFAEIPPLGTTPTPAFDEPAQERVMARLVGKYMGANPRQGATYPWIPNHLADTFRRVSPRSFLVALAEAARFQQKRATTGQHGDGVLAPGALMEGVKKASGQRVEELEEDFPWIREVSLKLEGLMVPCTEAKCIERLQKCVFSKKSRRGLRSEKPSEVLQQLRELGVFLRDERDGRYNVPDLYRVAMRMKRKGGIKPAK